MYTKHWLLLHLWTFLQWSLHIARLHQRCKIQSEAVCLFQFLKTDSSIIEIVDRADGYLFLAGFRSGVNRIRDEAELLHSLMTVLLHLLQNLPSHYDR